MYSTMDMDEFETREEKNKDKWNIFKLHDTQDAYMASMRLRNKKNNTIKFENITFCTFDFCSWILNVELTSTVWVNFIFKYFVLLMEKERKNLNKNASRQASFMRSFHSYLIHCYLLHCVDKDRRELEKKKLKTY